MSAILLTSIGLSTEKIRASVGQWIQSQATRNVLIMTNACKDGKENQYAKLAKEQLGLLGCTDIQMFDVVTDDLMDIIRAQILYICGGNTFKLMADIHRAQAASVIRDFFHRQNTMIVGVSAGSIVLGQSLETSFDENKAQFPNLDGLKLIPFSIIVHFNDSRMARYQQLSRSQTIKTLVDHQAILIDSNGEHYIV